MLTSKRLPFCLALVAAFSTLKSVDSHSWIHCTNYLGGMNIYDDSKCEGYPRKGAATKQSGFGLDTGMDSVGKCQADYVEGQADYAVAPKAEYKAGQTICLAYPSKNHVASPENVNIADHGVVISRTKKGDTTDTFDGATYENMNGVHQTGLVDYKGFQKCPEYRVDPNNRDASDKALCTMCFKLEDDLEIGEYSFLWNWEFNPRQHYHTCWEAKVVPGPSPADPPSAAPFTPTHAPPKQEGDMPEDIGVSNLRRLV